MMRYYFLLITTLLFICCSADNGTKAQSSSILQAPSDDLKQSSMQTQTMRITIDGKTEVVNLVNNTATQALVNKLKEGPINISLNTNGDFEIWGAFGFSLPTSNENINGQPGDVVLYAGSNICIFYGSNSYSYTRLGKINGLSASELKAFLKGGQNNISVTLSLPDVSAINHIHTDKSDNIYYTLNGQRVEHPTKGIYIINGKKIIL
ncbi:MAG: hypothetical protein J6I37_00895 [Prevotella sp.]|nr:hypothetical protein [Prevotella sp.]